MQSVDCELMTVGELSRRTGLSIKAIREYDALGLIYSAGRSEGNHRLFDESALWCARVIVQMRSVGLTIKEIKQLADAYLADPDEPIGPRIAAALDRVEHRVVTQLGELEALRRRIADYRMDNAVALAGRTNADFAAHDPRRSQSAA
jgi:MerR family transcriptional regulator, copper efflux regulator